MAASTNLCGFLYTILYFECENASQADNFIHRYNLKLTKSQWGKKRKQLRKDLLNFGNFVNDGANGEKELFLQYFSSGNYEALPEDELKSHTLHSCDKCQELHAASFFLRRKNKFRQLENIPPQAPQPDVTPSTSNTPRKVLRRYLEKTPEEITTGDIDTLANTVLKPITELTMNTEHKEHYYDKFFGKRKLPSHKWLSKKAKKEFTKAQMAEMKEDNEHADFLRLYTTCQSENEWQKQREKDLQYRKNRKKSHTANLNNYKYDKDLLLSELIACGGSYSKVNWTELSKSIKLVGRNDSRPANAGQVSWCYLCVYRCVSLLWSILWTTEI